MATLLKVFKRFPEEGQLIGNLATAYTELEFDLCMCVAMAVSNLDMVVKALYRTRGETQRIEVADAIGRQPYHALNLGQPFEEAVGAMRYCLKIRNQYSHCNWHDDLTGRISFLNLEEIAMENAVITNLAALTFRYLDVPLLKEQQMYFVRVSNNLTYLNYEGRKQAGLLTTHALQAASLSTRPPPYR